MSSDRIGIRQRNKLKVVTFLKLNSIKASWKVRGCFVLRIDLHNNSRIFLVCEIIDSWAFNLFVDTGFTNCFFCVVIFEYLIVKAEKVGSVRKISRECC